MDTWVFVETADGAPTRVSRELLAGGRSLGSGVIAFGEADALGALGLDLRRLGATAVVGIRGSVVAGVAGMVASGRACDVVLLPSSARGSELAGRLAARLGRPVICNGRRIVAGDDGGVAVETAILGGSTVVRTAFRGPRPWLATCNAGAFHAVEADADSVATSPAVELVEAPGGGVVNQPTVVAHHPSGGGAGRPLDEAAIVVAGGRGMGSADAFGRLGELAAVLDAAVGATRAAVDAGWVAHTAQVGQTGHTVAPTVYLAFGLSGAAQHLVGMRGSQHVIAVNTDRSAPVMALADVAVVGDAPAILERLLRALRDRAASP